VYRINFIGPVGSFLTIPSDAVAAIGDAGVDERDGLYVEARRELLAALAKDPDEPTLHFLLGQVYDTIGLGELAQREFIEASDLSPRSGG
jgi:Flp pilus assembly protein TadD